MNDYAVFIISHKRPEVKTLETLKKLGYSKDYFIVVDDKDPTIPQYQELYEDHVLIFSKEELLKETDTIDNFGTMTSCTYPRNYCIKAAKEKGYKYLINLDDDIKEFAIRYEDKGKFASKEIQNIETVFDKYIKFIEISGFNCGGFILSTKLIGGLENNIAKYKFYHTPMNAFILKTSSNFFSGSSFEDMIYSIRENSSGNLTFAFMPVVITPSPVLISSGGMADAYKNQDEYTQYFRVKIVNPAEISIKVGKNKSIYTQTHENYFVPKILHERWKK